MTHETIAERVARATGATVTGTSPIEAFDVTAVTFRSPLGQRTLQHKLTTEGIDASDLRFEGGGCWALFVKNDTQPGNGLPPTPDVEANDCAPAVTAAYDDDEPMTWEEPTDGLLLGDTAGGSSSEVACLRAFRAAVEALAAELPPAEPDHYSETYDKGVRGFTSLEYWRDTARYDIGECLRKLLATTGEPA